MPNVILSIPALIVGAFVHEIAHYLTAKREGVYKGWGILPTPHIKLTKTLGSRWGYLYGIIASYITIPLFVLSGFSVLYAIVMLTVLGSLDIFVFIFYDRIKD